MSIEDKIKQIGEEIKKLSSETSINQPNKWEKPLSEKEVSEFEKKNGIKLPLDYRKFITTVASSGNRPFYGLCNILKQEEFHNNVNLKFPFTTKSPFFISDEDTDKEEEEEKGTDNGYIALCTEGCGMNCILIVNTDDTETYGTVWFDDLANDFGIAPILNQKTKKPMKFLDWFEYWLDRALKSPNDDDDFSFGELTI